jgi:hypothetical protein
MARVIAADRLAQEALDIVDGKLPVLEDNPNKDTAVRVSRDVARAKHRVWMAGRMAPRKWGEAVDDQENVAPPTAVIIVEGTAAARAALKQVIAKNTTATEVLYGGARFIAPAPWAVRSL